MAVGAPTGLANGSNTGTLSSYATASQSPSANRLILAFISSTQTEPARPDVPSGLSGNGLTWICIGQFYSSTTSANRCKSSAWAAFTGASPSAGAVTITFPTAQTLCLWSFAEFSGTYLTSIDDAIRQSAWGEAPPAHHSGEAYLMEGQGSSNAIWMGMCHVGTETVTSGTGYTEIHEVAGTVPNEILSTQYRLGSARLADADWGSALHEAAVCAVELRAATSPIDWRESDLLVPRNKGRVFKTALISRAASGDYDIFAVTSGKIARVYGIVLISAGTVQLHLEGPTTDTAPIMLQAGEGYKAWVDPPAFIFQPLKSAVCSLSPDSAAQISGWVAYWEDDI